MERLKIKRKNVQYSGQAVLQALEEVKENQVTPWKASQNFKIPYRTLQRKIAGNNDGKVGRKQILSDEDEQQLVSWIRERAKMGYPLTKDDLTSAAAKIAERRGSSKFGPNGPSDKWYKNFMKRHNQVRSRKPEGLSKGAARVTQADIDGFLGDIVRYIDDKGLTEFFNDHPENFLNIDESAFEINSHPDKVLTCVDIPHTFDVEVTAHHKKITVTAAVAADGHMYSPQIIFKTGFSKAFDCSYAATVEKQEILFSHSQNGWQTSTTFMAYFIRVIAEMRARGVTGPIAALIDGCPSHINLEIQQWCNANNVILIIFLPNATQYIQPLDVVIFKALKAEEKKQKRQYMREQNKTEITEEDFIHILSRSIRSVMSVDLIKKGFETTSLFPLLPQFRHPERIISRPIPDSLPQPDEEVEIPSTSNNDPQDFSGASNKQSPEDLMTQIQNISQQLMMEVDKNDAASQMCFFSIQQQLQHLNSLKASAENVSNTTSASSQSPPQDLLSDILQVPSVPVQTRKRRFKLQRQGVISSREVITAVEEQRAEEEKKKEKSLAQKRARLEEKERKEKASSSKAPKSSAKAQKSKTKK